MRPPTVREVAHEPVEEMDQAKLGDSVPANSPSEIGQDEGVYVFPASLEQIRYWTLDQLDGASTASNMAIAARLEGAVDDGVVEQSIRAIVKRHEALRTTFRMVDDRLCQIISEEARYSFSITDLSALPEANREEAAADAIEEHSRARADLAAGPAFFVRLIHLSSQLHYLAFTMHHIVCDGWSNGILIRDFTDFYAAFSQHQEPALPELPFQFADFTVWQQNWLESDAAQAAIAYWRTHIHRSLPAVDLPTDRPRLPQKSYPGHIESTLLPATLTARLKAYCRANNATMHQVLLAAFEGLIARYANQSEFLLGSTIANRTQPGMENVVGRFANPQVILADVNGDPTYAQLLRRVSEWSTESYAHQDLPFSRLMEEFQLDQAGATSQFLQVYFVYQKAFMQPQEAPGLKVTPRPSVSGGVNFDLLVSIVERAEGPRLQMEYNTVLFRKERIVSLIEMYVRVLEAVMDDDSLTVSRLPLVSGQDEKAQISATGSAQTLAAVEAVGAASNQTISLAQCLDSRADAQANAVAILSVGKDKSLSWQDLRERSRTMASALRNLGVSAGQIVAMRLEYSANDAAAAWALLRIGAIVLPLPASSSVAEWNQLLSSQRPVLALASGSFAATVPGVSSYEELAKAGANQNAGADEDTYAQPSAIAWLGISVGHDGQLTTVPATHQATLQQLQSAADALDIRPGDVVLRYLAESATDAWIDLLLPLIAGSTLLSSGSSTPGEMQTLLERHQVSFVFTNPAGLLSAVHQRWTGDRRLNVVVRNGLLNSAQLKRLSATPLRLWTILSSALTAGPLAIAKIAGESQPGFLPLAGQRLTILDDNNQPVPTGVSGELALHSGENTVRTGYLARTAPLDGPESGGDGSIEILDSASRLVRLHGYRLRLGELEDFLWQSPAVADVVAAIVQVNEAPALVAYFQPFTPADNNARAARDHFQTVAPGHVAGAELIAVDAIPRRADGSADLTRLPAPGSSKRAETPSDEYLPPRDELESSLVAVWEDVLNVRPIGVRTSFFKLGGYSLMIVRLFARINKILGTALPITTIFNAPTVEQLADIVRGRAYYSALVPVQTKGTRPPFFMVHSYLLYQGIPAELGEDCPFYGLRELDTDAKDMTVEQRAAACLDEMRSIQPTGPYYIGGWCAAGPLAVETARQIVASGETVGFLVLFDSWRPGYAAELAREQAGRPEMSLRATLYRKYRFHRNRWDTLSFNQRVRYVSLAINNKFSSLRSKFYLKNWAFAEWFCHRFGLPLPHFMHNVSLTTLNSLKEYRGVEPYPGPMTLIRAKEAPYIPGAKEHCGWESIVLGGVNVLWAPGDHESMFLAPNLHTVGAFLRQSLAEAYAQQQRP
jgi:non-ribosomal peptide synthetase component F/thioesterase domain-containing protein